MGGAADLHLQVARQQALHAQRRTDELRVQLSFVLENEDRNTVFWIERRGAADNRPELPAEEPMDLAVVPPAEAHAQARAERRRTRGEWRRT